MKTSDFMRLLLGLMIATAPCLCLWARGTQEATDAPAKSASQKQRANEQDETYEASRERLRRAREVLRQTRDQAIEELQKQMQRAQEQLDALAKRLEEGAASAKTTALATARKAEQEIALRARRMEARSLLLAAKAKTSLAVKAAAKNDFKRAEKDLADATDLLRKARAVLVDDHVYDDQLDDMKVAFLEATNAIKAHAEGARKKIEKAVIDADLLVSSLEAGEQKAFIEGR